MDDNGDFNEIRKLKQINSKLCLINSDTQPTHTDRLAANNIPFKLLYIHSTGHFPMVEKPQEFNHLLDNVIADIQLRHTPQP